LARNHFSAQSAVVPEIVNWQDAGGEQKEKKFA
jgi:hypothetical protein